MKIADFGFAGPIAGRYGNGYLTTALGTRPYMAPEIHEKRPYKGEKVDIFSSAICLFIMITGLPPFNEARVDEFYYKFICKKNY
jgi:serine/threonine protein kinase